MKYSVALCTYNGEKFLHDQLQSIIQQTIPPKQIVVCDDCSTDTTNNIIEYFVNKFTNIHWKHVKNNINIGFIKNFEQAIQLCDEEIIFLSDQDDIWLEYKATIILNHFIEKPYSIYFTNASLIDRFGREINSSLFDVVNFLEPQQRLFNERMDRYLLLSLNFATGATLAFKRGEILKILPVPNNEYFIHDGWIVAAGICRNTVGFISQHLIKYRIHNNQAVGLKIDLNEENNNRPVLGLIGILTYRMKKEEVLLSFFEGQRDLQSQKIFSLLKSRKYLYERIISSSLSWWDRASRFSFKYYFLKIPEFNTMRLFFGNFFYYIFSNFSKEKST